MKEKYEEWNNKLQSIKSWFLTFLSLFTQSRLTFAYALKTTNEKKKQTQNKMCLSRRRCVISSHSLLLFLSRSFVADFWENKKISGECAWTRKREGVIERECSYWKSREKRRDLATATIAILSNDFCSFWKLKLFYFIGNIFMKSREFSQYFRYNY